MASSDTIIRNRVREVLGREATDEEIRSFRSVPDNELRNAIRAGTTGTLGTLASSAASQLEDQLVNAISELETKLNTLPMEITESEMEQFLQRAVEQVTPYYEKKIAEIEKGVREGKIRSAEDVLTEIREVRGETDILLRKWDVEQAETEEELADNLASITARKEEDLALKRDDWRQRIETSKMEQVGAGTLTSGVGRKYIGELLGRQELEEAGIERRAGEAEVEEKREVKYDLQRISLARESAEKERVRKIGTPEEEAVTTGAALGTLGYGRIEELPSRTEIARRRGEEPVTTYKPEALIETEEERKRAIESRRMELVAQTRAEREQEKQALRTKTVSELARKYKTAAPTLYSRYA